MARLIVSGTGILGVGHITLQTLGYIRHADIVLYLVADPITEQFIQEESQNSRSLYGHYVENGHRKPSYDGMVTSVLAELEHYDCVCVLFYGHPGVFVDPSHRMIRIASERGHSAIMLAGISSLDCLFSDAGFDPGPSGCQTFEATDFLLRKRRFDELSYLVLLQVGVIGDPSFQPNRDVAPNLHILTDYLLTRYPPDHEVII